MFIYESRIPCSKSYRYPRLSEFSLTTTHNEDTEEMPQRIKRLRYIPKMFCLSSLYGIRIDGYRVCVIIHTRQNGIITINVPMYWQNIRNMSQNQSLFHSTIQKRCNTVPVSKHMHPFHICGIIGTTSTTSIRCCIWSLTVVHKVVR